MKESYDLVMMPLAERLNNLDSLHRADVAEAFNPRSCREQPTLPVVSGSAEGALPDVLTVDMLRQIHIEASAVLKQNLLARIYANSPQFFEGLIIDVLLKMGYANRRRDLAHCLGRSHDGGVDGVLHQDELGLDVIYLQAKRLKPGSTVPVSHLRDFVGSLEAKHANKGVFVTTAQFTTAAQQFLSVIPRRIRLIDGNALTDLMIRHNIGVCVVESYQFKDIEPDYFAVPKAGSHRQPVAFRAAHKQQRQRGG